MSQIIRSRAGNTSLVTAVKHRLLAEIARDDAFLAGLLDRRAARRLDAGALTNLNRSIAGDRAALAALATVVQASNSVAALHEVAAQVRGLRADVYGVVLIHLRALVELAETASRNAVDLSILAENPVVGSGAAAPSALQADLISARLLNAEATNAAAAARVAALQLNASSRSAVLSSVSDQVHRVEMLLDHVEVALHLVGLALAASEGVLSPA